MRIIKELMNNKGMGFLEALLMILLVVLVIAIPLTGLSQALSDVFITMVDRVNQIGTP